MIRDLAFRSNPTTAISRNEAFRASTYIPDTTGQVITNYTLDLQEDILRLTFDEPVLPSTLNLSLVSLSSSSNASFLRP